jgi:mRNA interferase MazF
MAKDFSGWLLKKQGRDARPSGPPYCNEREIWWAAIGLNIGFEEDGKGAEYARPVLVVRKFGGGLFYALPLSTTERRGPFYHPFEYKGWYAPLKVDEAD